MSTVKADRDLRVPLARPTPARKTKSKPKTSAGTKRRPRKPRPRATADARPSPTVLAGPATHSKKTLSTPAVLWETRPLLEPRQSRGFESLQTFNAGAVVIDDRVHFLYRAIGGDFVSRFGYANSRDGVHLDERLDEPAFQYSIAHPSHHSYASGGSLGGIEDPRITRIEGNVYVTYTVADDKGLGVAMTSMKVDDFLGKRWDRATVRAISPRSEVHKNWVFFPGKVRGKYALIHSISPRILVHSCDDLEFEGADFVKSYHNGTLNGHWNGGWEGRIRGVGAPPIKTDHGWLVFYHALPKGSLDSYCIGSMLLDLDDPTTVLFRSAEPLVTPWDIGDVVKPNVVYSCGAVVKGDDLLVYYGAGDTRVCVARTGLDLFMKNLMNQSSEPMGRA